MIFALNYSLNSDSLNVIIISLIFDSVQLLISFFFSSSISIFPVNKPKHNICGIHAHLYISLGSCDSKIYWKLVNKVYIRTFMHAWTLSQSILSKKNVTIEPYIYIFKWHDWILNKHDHKMSPYNNYRDHYRLSVCIMSFEKWLFLLFLLL